MRGVTAIGLLTIWWGCTGLAVGREPLINPPSSTVTPIAVLAAPRSASQASAGSLGPDQLTAAEAILQPDITHGGRKSEFATTGDDTKDREPWQKQIEALQKQLDALQRKVEGIGDQSRKQPSATDIDVLRLRAAGLAVQAREAAERDRELAGAVDDLREQTDAERRWGPALPAPLKELFLPSGTNETPVSIYGQLLANYHQFNARAGQFETPDFAPYFLVRLNDCFLLEANIDINNAGVSVAEAQVDCFVTDWLTVVVGRFITPIGFFNERLNHEWINKLPDVPLMFRQVSPLVNTDGVQLRGAFYPTSLPVKVEYSIYGGNGFQLTSAPTTVGGVADLEAITGGPDEIDARAAGGRLGLWLPEWGITGGISGFVNGRYSPGASDQFNLWQVDFGFSRGNWDARLEFADLYQQAASYIGNSIRRTGMYAQLAYRPRDCEIAVLQNTEVVFRYSRARFSGIDPTQLDPTAFATPVDVPVDRDQYTFGVNYYFYPSMVFKLAYEINVERGGADLHDNVFLAQFAWAF
jgi:hypothetical protein